MGGEGYQTCYAKLWNNPVASSGKSPQAALRFSSSPSDFASSQHLVFFAHSIQSWSFPTSISASILTPFLWARTAPARKCLSQHPRLPDLGRLLITPSLVFPCRHHSSRPSSRPSTQTATHPRLNSFPLAGRTTTGSTSSPSPKHHRHRPSAWS